MSATETVSTITAFPFSKIDLDSTVCTVTPSVARFTEPPLSMILSTTYINLRDRKRISHIIYTMNSFYLTRFSIHKRIAELRVCDTDELSLLIEQSAPRIPALGEKVFAIGNPEGDGISVTEGVISVDSEYIQLPCESNNPPPEFPGLIAASVRMTRILTAVPLFIVDSN